jgi:transcriptional regulator with XRE-family HTH domain
MENRSLLEIDPIQGKMTPAELRAWRRSRGLIQRAAAALLGVARRTYQYAERGKTRGSNVLITVPRQLELAVKGLDVEMGATRLSDQELRAAYSRIVVSLEDAAGAVPTYRPAPPRTPRILPADKK